MFSNWLGIGLLVYVALIVIRHFRSEAAMTARVERLAKLASGEPLDDKRFGTEQFSGNGPGEVPEFQMGLNASVWERYRKTQAKSAEWSKNRLVVFAFVLLVGTTSGMVATVFHGVQGVHWMTLIDIFSAGIFGAVFTRLALTMFLYRTSGIWAISSTDFTAMWDPKSLLFKSLMIITAITASAWATVGFGFECEFDWMIFSITTGASIGSVFAFYLVSLPSEVTRTTP